MKKVFLIILILCGLLGFICISTVKADNPTQADIDYIHDFFSNYCEFHESFHSFLDGSGEAYYNKKTPEDWKNKATEMNNIYTKLKALKPTPQFEDNHEKYLDEFEKQVNIWDRYIKAKENNPEDYDLPAFMIDLSMNRINLSKFYANIFHTYNPWPKEFKDKVNTPDLITKWNRMEDRKRKILSKY